MPIANYSTKRYQQKLANLGAGIPVSFTPAEFLHYALYINNIPHKRFNEALGYHSTYITQVFSHFNGTLPPRLIQKLVVLTGTEHVLWSAPNIDPARAADIDFDFTKDVTHVAEPEGGSHAKRLEDLERLGLSNSGRNA